MGQGFVEREGWGSSPGAFLPAFRRELSLITSFGYDLVLRGPIVTQTTNARRLLTWLGQSILPKGISRHLAAVGEASYTSTAIVSHPNVTAQSSSPCRHPRGPHGSCISTRDQTVLKLYSGYLQYHNSYPVGADGQRSRSISIQLVPGGRGRCSMKRFV
jgi:hypothetical protein